MKNKTKSFILAAAGIALLATAAFILWFYSLEGSKGLVEWGWRKIVVGIAVLGVLPLLIALEVLGVLPLFLSLTGLIRFRDEGSKAGGVFSAVSLALSCAVILSIAGGWGFLESKARAFSGPAPALNLVDPAKGIIPADSPAGGKVLRLAASSDPHWSASTSNAKARSSILAAIAAEQPRRDAFFILGDTTQFGFNEGEWKAGATELSDVLGNLPIRPLLGNHDALMGGQSHYLQYYFPAGMSSDSGSPYWYSIEAGAARIVVLDLLWGAEDFNAGKRAWLEKTLASVPAGERIIVLSHCFFASSGYLEGPYPWYDHYGTLASVSPILEKYKVDLVIQGHNHYMELLRRKGVTYATVGAMGGKPDPEPSHVSPDSLWFRRGAYGWLDLDVEAKGITLTFRDQSGGALETAFVPATR